MNIIEDEVTVQQLFLYTLVKLLIKRQSKHK